MARDGKIQFYKQLNWDKKDLKLLIWFKKLVRQMLNEKDPYSNGRINTENN